MKRFRHRDRKRLYADANITPLVDACLVLLIIFMISSPFIINQTVNIALPRTLSASAMNERDELSIYAVYDAESRTTVISIGNDKNLKHDQVRSIIKERLAGQKSRNVRIFSDGNVPMKKIIELTDIVLSTGGKIQIVTEYGETGDN
ncbi:MAG TPA: biopolymer transporter ExbD [Spirochaetota bacterium]|nr:biopolymer transporter ExbD [Spirochaetota bacterium]HQO39135.1 biopolymer transporter ExbD [Spirochaetota bacterium]